MKNLFLFIMLLLPMAASADQSGTCGENLTWTFNEATGTLTISGSGEMFNYYSNPSPWKKHRENIRIVIIEDGVTSIGEYAFSGCRGLTSVTIPNSVTSIRNYTFEYCSGLTSVHISDLEAWCNISVSNYASNPLYYAHHLLLNGEEIKNLVIPNSVTRIRSYAFSGCSGLTSVTIPNSVTSIRDDAFSHCSGLTSVSIPNSVTSIEWNAFSGCSGLTSVTIPNSVTFIDPMAFSGCI